MTVEARSRPEGVPRSSLRFSIVKTLLDVVKVARPGFWPTHLWFYLLPFAEEDMFGLPAFWLGAVYVCFPLGLLLYGWNDLGDVVTDRNNPRKDSWLFGARPDEALRRKLPFIIALSQLPFVVAFVVVAGPKMLLWFLAMVMANGAYNQLDFKSKPVFDLLNQVGYLLIFVLASWLCFVPQLHPAALVFSALFAMQSHLFGQLMDIEEDRAAGRRLTAVVVGVVRAKLIMVIFMIVESSIAFRFFSGGFVGAFMAAGAVFFMVDALRGPARYPTLFLKLFFAGWNFIVLSTMYVVWRFDIFQVTT